MNTALRQHFENQNLLPPAVIDEVMAMFNDEAIALIDWLSAMKPAIRDIVLSSLRDYHAALDSNKNEFVAIAGTFPTDAVVANSDTLLKKANG
jgi:hypothetical protein